MHATLFYSCLIHVVFLCCSVSAYSGYHYTFFRIFLLVYRTSLNGPTIFVRRQVRATLSPQEEAFVYEGRQQLPQVHHMREGRHIPRQILLETVLRTLWKALLEPVSSEVHDQKAKRLLQREGRYLERRVPLRAMAVQIWQIKLKVYPPKSRFPQIELPR